MDLSGEHGGDAKSHLGLIPEIDVADSTEGLVTIRAATLDRQVAAD